MGGYVNGENCTFLSILEQSKVIPRILQLDYEKERKHREAGEFSKAEGAQG